jgi:hypothetical protein
MCHNQLTAVCADIKEVKTTDSKGSAKQEFESSPYPTYSSELAPSDFHLFYPLEDAVRRRRFPDDDELKQRAGRAPTLQQRVALYRNTAFD